MAAIRVMLSLNDLKLLEHWATRMASDNEGIRLKTKIQKALISVGGTAEVYDGSGPSRKAMSEESRLESIINASINDEEISDDDKEYYYSKTGLRI